MLVFAAHPSNRLEYILNQILKNRLGIDFKITDNPSYFLKSPSLKINYSTEIIEGCLNVPASNLLYEEDIRNQEIIVRPDPLWKHLFYEIEFDSIPDFRIHSTYLPFDILAASFYLLSRYEEYLTQKKDAHNRFKPEDSLALKHGFLKLPLIDIWVEQFSKVLLKQYPELQLKENQFTQINTIDIDFAYKFKGLSWWQKTRKFIGSLTKFKPDIRAFSPPYNDPYDTYNFLTQTSSQHQIKTIFFFLLANYGAYDKNISPHTKEMRELANNLHKDNSCGIHPSYKAGINSKLYAQEHTVFKQLFNKSAILSRHHFLKIRLPESYSWMEKFGITQDFSMAYSSQVGFRASTSMPFQFYNLQTNHSSPVVLFSPCVMDVTLKNSLNLSPESAIKLIEELKQTVHQVNGTFISIWHNSSFDPEEGWSQWEQVYQSLFE